MPSEPFRFRHIPTPDDVEAVEELAREAGVFSAAEIAIAGELVEEAIEKGAEVSGYHFLLADGPKRLDGFTCFGPMSGTVKRFEMYWIAVHPLALRSHLGRRLEHATEDAVRALGGVRLIAESSMTAPYAPARAFYLAQGYRLIADVPDWYNDGDNLAIFAKKL